MYGIGISAIFAAISPEPLASRTHLPNDFADGYSRAEAVIDDGHQSTFVHKALGQKAVGKLTSPADLPNHQN